jgi:hypothetical protein
MTQRRDSRREREEIHNSHWTDEKIGVFYFLGPGGGTDFRALSASDHIATAN